MCFHTNSCPPLYFANNPQSPISTTLLCMGRSVPWSMDNLLTATSSQEKKNVSLSHNDSPARDGASWVPPPFHAGSLTGSCKHSYCEFLSARLCRAQKTASHRTSPSPDLTFFQPPSMMSPEPCMGRGWGVGGGFNIDVPFRTKYAWSLILCILASY